MALSKNLKALRKARHLTQDEFAKQTGIGRSATSMYESGKREPNYATLRQIAKFYNVSTDYLLNNNDNVIVLPQEPKQMLELSENELELIMKFRELPKTSQDNVKYFIKCVYKYHVEPDPPERA